MKCLLTTLVWLLGALNAFGYTNNAPIFRTSGTLADVQAAHDDAACTTGSTIEIPASTNTWSDTLHITKAITLKGAGEGSTTLKDDMPATGNWSDKAMIWLSLVSGQTTTVRNIRFEDAAGAKSGTADGGLILVQDTYSINSTARGVIRNCTFYLMEQDAGIIRSSDAFGVTSQCTFTRTSSHFTHIVGSGNGLSWADDSLFGTDKFWIMENCTDTQNDSTPYETIDSDRGARWVVRYCTLNNTRFGMHGSDSGANQRSTRAYEIYNNTISSDGISTPLLLVRGGTGVFHDNTVTNFQNTTLLILQAYRATDDPGFSWGQADGSNGWDDNDTNNPIVASTSTSGSGLTMTDSGKSWTTDQWIGYILKNTATSRASIINGNTATVITFRTDEGYGTGPLSFTGAQGYRINRVPRILDMPGLGKGTMTNDTTPAACDSAVEAIYEWNNTVDGSNGTIATTTSLLVEGTHFYNDTTKPGYTPLTYPHPLITAQDGGGAVPGRTPRSLAVRRR